MSLINQKYLDKFFIGKIKSEIEGFSLKFFQIMQLLLIRTKIKLLIKFKIIYIVCQTKKLCIKYTHKILDKMIE
jgi:hypothetical protein